MQKQQEGAPTPRATWFAALADEPRFLMLLPGLFWAGNAIVARSIADEIPPIALAFWRWTVAAVLIAPLAWPHLRRDAAVMVRQWPTMLLLSALGISIFNTLLYIGAHSTTAINLVMLQTTMPIVVVIATFLIFRETLTGRQAAGIALSLAGALTLISHGDPAILLGLDFNRGDLWMLAAIVTYAVYTALLRLRPAVHGLSFAFATFAIGATLLLPFYIGETLLVRPLPISTVSILAIGYVAIFASILSYLAFNRVVALLGANTAGLIVHLVPVFGTILAVLLLGERLHAYNLAGIALIALGIWLATRRPASG
ncbi:DMT family transporter [Hyphomicrobium sp.]|uniref:DMT family transporter n=1 Tax=Hyphomicrobium sp. TaxID=82 RepID=UPI0025BB3B12|nr:DMT family transporter [Hyphomicrobium sp.]MCC7252607.1 DMT family transporter [Hyphomicrobium sp.]